MRRARLVLLALLLLGAPAQGQQPPGGEVITWAQVRQEVLPELVRRREVARQKIADRKLFFSGKGSFEDAFPDLSGAAVEAPGALRGRLLQLDALDAARALERVAPITLTKSRRIAVLRAAREAAFDAEETMVSLERRAVLALLEQLSRNPAMTASSLREVRAPLEAIIASAAGLSAEDEDARQALAAAAAAAQSLQALEALLHTLRLQVLVPGAPAPDPAADIAALDDPATADAAAGRLQVMRLSLPDPSSVEAALIAWMSSTRLVAARSDLYAAEAETGREAEVSIPGATSSTEKLPVTVEELDALIDALEAEAARLRAAGVAPSISAQADRALEDATRARQEADAAAAAARSASERRMAVVLGATADAQQRASELWELVRASKDQHAAASEETAARLDEVAARTEALLSRSSLLLDRNAVDAQYAELRSIMASLRTRIRARESALLDAQRRLEQTATTVAEQRVRIEEAQSASSPESASAARLAEALETWSAALTDAEDAAQALYDSARTSRDDAVRALDDTRRLRQQLKPVISSAPRQRDRGFLLLDLQQEAGMLRPRLQVLVSDQIRSLKELPGRLLDFNTLRGMFLGSFWAVLMLVGWWVGRGRARRAADGIIDWIASRKSLINRSDLEPSVPPLVGAIQTFLDLAVGWVMLETVASLSAGLGLAMSIYLHIALFRFLLALFALLFARHPAVRPSLRTFRPEVYDRLRRTVRVLLLWSIGRALVREVLQVVLGLFTLAGLVDTVFALLGLALVAWQLHGWEPSIRKMISRRKGAVLVSYLSRPPRSAVLAAPNAAVGLLFLVVTALSELIPRLAHEGSQFGAILTRFSRYRLSRSDAKVEELEPLPPELIERLLAPAPEGETLIAREEVTDAVVKQIRRWKDTQRRGVLGVVSDRGDGRRVTEELIATRLVAAGLAPVMLHLKHRVCSEAGIIAWMREALALETQPQTAEQLIEQLRCRPPTIFLLDGLHRAFLRTVGGFEGMRTLLYVLNATSDRHFWVTLLFRPSWRYLSSLKDLVNAGVVQTIVEVPLAREGQLRALTFARAARAGFTLDFSRLVRPSPLGADPGVEQEQAIRLFFRLLAEASAGRITVALRMWASCLTRGHEPGVLEVWAHPCLSQTDIPDLTTGDLLALTALRIQDTVSEVELADLLDVSAGRLRADLKDLQSRGLIDWRGDELTVALGQIPVVTRALRRRNFLQWS